MEAHWQSARRQWLISRDPTWARFSLLISLAGLFGHCLDCWPGQPAHVEFYRINRATSLGKLALRLNRYMDAPRDMEAASGSDALESAGQVLNFGSQNLKRQLWLFDSLPALKPSFDAPHDFYGLASLRIEPVRLEQHVTVSVHFDL
jgi:hypothetical protein